MQPMQGKSTAAPRKGPRPPEGKPEKALRRGPRPPSTERTNGVKEIQVPPPSSPVSLASTDVESQASNNMASRMAGNVSKQIRQKHACERAFTCALAVSFLWMTSLGMAKAIVSFFVPSPSVDQVTASVDLLAKVTEEQSDAYKFDAQARAKSCQVNFVADTREESALLTETQRLLDVYINQTEATMLECTGAFEDTVDLIGALNLRIADYKKDDRFLGVNCTSELEQVLEAQGKKINVLLSAEDFKVKADAKNKNLDNQLKNRVLYDLNFLNERTGGYLQPQLKALEDGLTNPEKFKADTEKSFNQAMACVAITRVSNGEICPESSLLGKVRTSFDEGKDKFDRMQENAEKYRERAFEQYNKYRELYFKIKAIYEVLDDASLVALAGFKLPPVPAAFNDFLENVIGIDLNALLENPEKINELAKAAALEQLNAISQATANINASNIDFTDASSVAKTTFFADYNPPKVDDDPEDYNEASGSFVDSMATDLDAITSDNGKAFVSDGGRTISNAKTNLVEKAEARPWEYFLYSDSIFNNVQFGYESLSQWALILDYTYRILKSLMLIRKYWNISAINMPPADVRTKLGKDQGLFQEKASPIQAMANILTHPAFNLLLMLIFAVFFCWSFYLAYSPLYNQYTEGCVNSCWSDLPTTLKNPDGTPQYDVRSQGTMFYRNGYAVAQQYSSGDGDYVVTTQIDPINVERDVACRDNATAALDVTVFQNKRFDFYNRNQANALDKISRLKTCFDFTKANATAATQGKRFTSKLLTCNSGFISPDVVVTKANQARKPPLKPLSRLYRCENIRPCSVEAIGTSEPVVRAATFSTTCTAEWYFHASTLGFVLVAAVYFIMNLSRYILFRGLVKVFWRHLVANRFSYLASCTADGKVIYPEDVTEKGESFHSVIIKNLKLGIKAFEREGLFEVAFSAIINLPWIFILVVLKSSLAFDSSKECSQT